MTAPAFTKFDPRAFLQNEERRGTAAKPAKAAKAPEREPEPSATLATLATLAGGQTETQNFEAPPDTWTDAQEERAAIVEYDGGAPRAWAEALARLDPNNHPATCRRGVGCVSLMTAAVFSTTDGPHARQLSAGGRSICSAAIGSDRSLASITLGLLWLLNGGTMVELHRDRAIIETESGARQTYRRRPVEVGRVVLAWEIAP